MATERSVLVRLKADVSDFVRGMRTAAAAVDTTNDRVAWMTQSILALGPTLAPLGAAAVPVLSGIATQMTVAAGAAGTMALGLVGIGDALEKVNKYQIDPTDANLKSMTIALEKVGPAGREFVMFLDQLGPQLTTLRDVAREGMFPGMEVGIRRLMDLLPDVKILVGNLANGIGELSIEAGTALSGDRFAAFFDYLQQEGQPILMEMGHTLGNFADGIAAMLVAFAPMSRDFSGGFEEMSRSFAEWAHGLETSDSFSEFVNYVNESVPKALSFLGALTDAFVEIGKAAAPVGDVLLPALTIFLRVLDQITATPIGSIFIAGAAALGIYARSVALAKAATGGLASQVMFAGLKFRELDYYATLSAGGLTIKWAEIGKNFAKIGGAIGLTALSMSELDNKAGLTHTTMLSLTGLMMKGPWTGGALGLVGLIWDGVTATTELEKALQGAKETVTSGDLTTDSDILTLQEQVDTARKKLAELQAEFEAGASVASNFKGAGAAVASGQAVAIRDAEQQLADYSEQLDYAQERQQWLADTAEVAARSTGVLNRAMRDAGITAAQEQKALLDNVDAMREKRAEAARGLNAELDYQSALLDSKDALEENGKTADITTREGIDNRQALYDIATAWNAQSDAAKNAKGSFEAAKQEFLDFAKQIGIKGPEAKRLARELFERKPSQQVEVYVKTHAEELDELWRDIMTFDGATITVTARVAFQTPNAQIIEHSLSSSSTSTSTFIPNRHSADGATVPKTGLGYADRHVYLLADGEEVVSNRYGQADRHRDLLKAINANRLADGGTAQRYATAARSAGASGGFGVSAAELSSLVMQAVNAQRPIYGDVHVQPHNYSEFVREQKQDMARVSGGGLRR